jgi:hypothetical protein
MDDRLIRNGCFKKSLLEMMITVTTDDGLTTSDFKLVMWARTVRHNKDS